MTNPAVPAGFGPTDGLTARSGASTTTAPTPAHLAELLGAVERGEQPFLTVARIGDDETYVQFLAMGGLLIERRDGAADRHYSTSVATADAAIGYLAGWTNDDRDGGLAWDHMQF